VRSCTAIVYIAAAPKQAAAVLRQFGNVVMSSNDLERGFPLATYDFGAMPPHRQGFSLVEGDTMLA
jgi:hypothetical protein